MGLSWIHLHACIHLYLERNQWNKIFLSSQYTIFFASFSIESVKKVMGDQCKYRDDCFHVNCIFTGVLWHLRYDFWLIVLRMLSVMLTIPMQLLNSILVLLENFVNALNLRKQFYKIPNQRLIFFLENYSNKITSILAFNGTKLLSFQYTDILKTKYKYVSVIVISDQWILSLH